MFWRLLLSTSSISTECGRDAQHFVVAIDDFSFRRDEDVFSFRQKNLFGLTRFAGESEKLQVDGWRRRRWRRALFCLFFPVCLSRRYGRWNLRLRQEDVPACAFVLGIFTVFQPVIAQGGIERTRPSANFLAVSLGARGWPEKQQLVEQSQPVQLRAPVLLPWERNPRN